MKSELLKTIFVF